MGVEDEGPADDLAVPAGELEAVRTPAEVGAHHHHLPSWLAAGTLAAMLLQEQAVDLHQPVDALVVGGSEPVCRKIAVQDAVIRR